MGSFNVACSFSNISIDDGDPVVYFALEPYKYGNKIGDGNNTLIYPHCIYVPVTMPIFGLYDDYGRIGYIEKTKAVEITESFFDMDIKNICSLEKMPKPCSSGMFVHRHIFDHFLNVSLDDGNKTYLTREELLSELGDCVEKAQAVLKMSKRIEKITELGNEHTDIWPPLIGESLGVFSFRDYQTFNEIYRPHIVNGTLIESVVDFRMFVGAMFDCNRFFFPAMNGYQFGNPYMSKELCKVTNKILDDKIKKLND